MRKPVERATAFYYGIFLSYSINNLRFCQSDVSQVKQADSPNSSAARSRGLVCFGWSIPGVLLRFTPGFMLTPAPQAQERSPNQALADAQASDT
jgi:hypothetical protein